MNYFRLVLTRSWWAVAISLILGSSFAFAGHGSWEVKFGGENIGSKVPRASQQMTGLSPGKASFYFRLDESETIADKFDSLGLNGILPDIPTVIDVARKKRDGSWTEWIPMDINQFDGGRFWAKAIFATSESGEVRFRVRGEGTPSKRAMDLYSLEAFTTPKAGTEKNVVEPAGWRSGRPSVVSRSQWGARRARSEEEMSPYRMTLHHTEGGRPTSRSAAVRELLAIQSYHMNGRGWDDIGYHFLIDGSGNIYEGRPEYLRGAHVAENNPGNVGVSVMGNYGNYGVNRAQMEALKTIFIYLSKKYGIGGNELYGHRNLNPTSCPGGNLYGRLSDIRRALRRWFNVAGSEGKSQQVVGRLNDSIGNFESSDGFDGK